MIAGKNKGCYYHEMFLRGKQFLANYIRRSCPKKQHKGGVSQSSPPLLDLDSFPSLPPMENRHPASIISSSSKSDETTGSYSSSDGRTASSFSQTTMTPDRRAESSSYPQLHAFGTGRSVHGVGPSSQKDSATTASSSRSSSSSNMPVQQQGNNSPLQFHTTPSNTIHAAPRASLPAALPAHAAPAGLSSSRLLEDARSADSSLLESLQQQLQQTCPQQQPPGSSLVDNAAARLGNHALDQQQRLASLLGSLLLQKLQTETPAECLMRLRRDALNVALQHLVQASGPRQQLQQQLNQPSPVRRQEQSSIIDLLKQSLSNQS